MEAGLQDAKIKQRDQQQLKSELSKQVDKSSKKGSDSRKFKEKQRRQTSKHCAFCAKAGKSRWVVQSHNESECHNKKSEPDNEKKGGKHGNVHRLKKKRKRTKKDQKKTSKRRKKHADDSSSFDSSSYSNRSNSTSNSDDSFNYSRPKRLYTIDQPSTDIDVESSKKGPYKNYYMSPESKFKRVKTSHLKNPKLEVIVKLSVRDQDVPLKKRMLRALLDTGADGTIILKRYATKKFASKIQKSVPQTWNTRGGVYKTTRRAEI
jgi:hypothetical protein